jgi:molecular chaperone GrpE
VKIPIKKSGSKTAMSKSNGHADIRIEEQVEQAKKAPEQELPPADPADGFTEVTDSARETEAASSGPAPQVTVEHPARDAEELQKLRKERDNLFDRLARLQAEFDNYRKRIAKENTEFRDYAVAESAKSLLPVMDNFSLALKNAGAKPEDLRKGVELIHKQLQDVLQKMNVQPIAAQGQPFDPRVHEAIEMVESNDAEDNHVLEELQPGYRIKERLLRPAMVRVARNTKKQD